MKELCNYYVQYLIDVSIIKERDNKRNTIGGMTIVVRDMHQIEFFNHKLSGCFLMFIGLFLWYTNKENRGLEHGWYFTDLERKRHDIF